MDGLSFEGTAQKLLKSWSELDDEQFKGRVEEYAEEEDGYHDSVDFNWSDEEEERQGVIREEDEEDEEEETDDGSEEAEGTSSETESMSDARRQRAEVQDERLLFVSTNG